MIGRREREGPLMRNNPHSLRKSRIVTAVVIGVLIGCILAFFFPNGFFVSQSIVSNRRIHVVGSKTQVFFAYEFTVFVVFCVIVCMCMCLILMRLLIVGHCGIVLILMIFVDSKV